MASGEHGSGRFGGESSGKSDVWKYFDKSADGKKAECKLCSKVLAYHGRTSNLRSHLQGQHPLKYETKQASSTEKGKEKQVTLPQSVPESPHSTTIALQFNGSWLCYLLSSFQQDYGTILRHLGECKDKMGTSNVLLCTSAANVTVFSRCDECKQQTKLLKQVAEIGCKALNPSKRCKTALRILNGVKNTHKNWTVHTTELKKRADIKWLLQIVPSCCVNLLQLLSYTHFSHNKRKQTKVLKWSSLGVESSKAIEE